MKSGRELKRYGGEVGSLGLINQETLPEYFEIINQQIFSDNLFPGMNSPIHVLLNKYRPGDGIMPHKDGPAYFPYVCILSLNSGIMLNIYESVDNISQTLLRTFSWNRGSICRLNIQIFKLKRR